MFRKAEYLCIMLFGGTVYGLIEIAWRGYTHWSMTIAGGVCLALIHLINHRLTGKSLLLRCALGSVVITSVEFAVGVVVNLILGLDVWDYSDMPGNILGQVCPVFMFLWFILSIPACYLSNVTRKFFDYLKNREVQPV